MVMPNFVDTQEFRPTVPGVPADAGLEEAGGVWRRRIATEIALFAQRSTPARERAPAPVSAPVPKHVAGGQPLFVLLCPRRLVPKNGVDVAVRALASIPSHCELPVLPVLVCAGDGPGRADLGQLARELGVERNVVFLGDIAYSDMPGLYAASDAVVVPSVSSHGVVEATSISALEAMASGIPVVASAIGGLTELIQDGENGLLTPEGDSDALAAAMAHLVENPGSRRRLGSAARCTAVSTYSYLTGCENLLRIYKEARRLEGR